MSHPPRPVTLDDQGLPVGYRFRPEWEVTPRQVKQLLDQKQDLVLIDCRLPQEHDLAKIPGSVLIPLQDVARHADELLEMKDKKVVVHCHHGGRSLQMTAMLRQYGFSDVKSMAGGIDVWSVDIDPSVTRY